MIIEEKVDEDRGGARETTAQRRFRILTPEGKALR